MMLVLMLELSVMVSWSEQFSVSPSEGGMNLCLSFLSAIYLSPGRELLSWVADILGCVSRCTDKSILTSPITVRSTRLSRPEFDQGNFAGLENLYPNTDIIRIRTQIILTLCVSHVRAGGGGIQGEEPISVSACWQFCFVCSLTV